MNKNTKEKVCAFYASDYHFEMISLPYINKRMENKDEIIILTEDNLEKTIQTVLSKINLKEEKKQEIIKLNWKNEDSNKFKKMQEKINQNKNMIVFVKGNEKYINNVNKNMEKIIKDDTNIKIIDCYNIEEVEGNFQEVINQYQKVLNTTGEKEIKKI